MKPLFSKSFWCVLAIALLTSFSAEAGMDKELKDLFEDAKRADAVKNKSDFNTVSDFCKNKGNYKALKEHFEEKDGDTFLYLGKAACFPPALANSIAKTQKKHSILTGWTNEKMKFKWWKGIFDTLTDAVVNITDQTWDSVAESTVKLLAAGFAMWIAMITLPMVGSFKEQNPADYLMKVGGKAFKIFFAVLLLQNKTFFFDYIVSPIMEVAAGFAGVEAGGGSGVQSVVTPLRQMMDEMHKQLAELSAIATVMMNIGWSVDAFLLGIQLSILGLIDLSFLIPLFNLLNIWVLISGCTIWIGALVLSIFFPFRVFDVVFRFGIILAIAPLYIAAWCFDITKDFATKGFNAILHVAFTFMFLKITLDLCILLIIGAAGLEEVYALVQGGGSAYQIGSEIIGAYLDSGSALTQLLTIIICIVFCCMCLTKADELASQFAQFQATSNAAERMGGAVVQNVQKTANNLKNEARDAFLENHVDGKAEQWAKSGNSLKSALGRSYLRHRGADRNELKEARNAHLDAKKSQQADKANKKAEKGAEKNAKKEQKAQDKAAQKQAKQEKRDLRKTALKDKDSKEMRDLYKKQATGEGLKKEEQERLNALEESHGGHGSALNRQIHSDAMDEVKHPSLTAAHQVAGEALRTRDKQKEFHHNVGTAVKTKAQEIRGKQKEFHHNVGNAVKNSAPVTAVRNAATTVKGKAQEIRGKQKEFHHNVGNAVKEKAQEFGSAVKNSAPVTAVRNTAKAVKDKVDDVRQDAKDYREAKQTVRSTQTARMEYGADQESLIKQQSEAKEKMSEIAGKTSVGEAIARHDAHRAEKRGKKDS